MAEKRKKKNEIILVLILVLLTAGSFLFTRISAKRHAAESYEVVVSMGGEVQQVYSLSDTVDVVLHTPYGETNHLVIRDGYAAITEASCPDKICVQTGKLKEPGELSVCLPNQIVVSIR